MERELAEAAKDEINKMVEEWFDSLPDTEPQADSTENTEDTAKEE